MKNIATLTLNPTIDVAYEVDRVFATHKMRTLREYHNPGGGGINVARVFVRLGGNARVHYMSGGATGVALDGLLDRHQLVRAQIPIEGATRVATSVLERESGKEYRFVPLGPVVSEAECDLAMERLAQVECDYFVASGSLPQGVPEDFYGQLAAKLAPRGVGFVLDSSGAGLRGGLAGGNVLLVKPSQGELQQLVGEALEGKEAIAAAAQEIVRKGQARYVAVTLGHEGAILATEQGTLFHPALPIEAKSAVGAGDSFVAAMVYALASDWPVEDAFRYGIAGGSAAVLTPGTDLARPADIDRLYATIKGG
ncbi:MAG: 1-phosphofructokinase family hexose kinase [Alphaproteobacteria bacterium]|nr:1-phosphofructokinase family hexose kinase [Alphaproteobacteria bacterium]MBU0795115.1 1-phosphofructokinase family hexose kinase [Alphaproteobacteria bacterium]MBU0874579.1 1-phosphofructokinase family hexose kinase [Alphaproteobacteria bacterium]MBU1769892.1 1-phosphofructokinase family hexose kinase [Alphaproteobacteria bacterium]